MKAAAKSRPKANGKLGERLASDFAKQHSITGTNNSNVNVNETDNISPNSNAKACYTVLYYKRKNKVHKSKGVSKLDGVLTVTMAAGSSSAPKVSVTLRSTASGDVDGDDGDGDGDNDGDNDNDGDGARVIVRGQLRGAQSVGLAVDETVSVGAYEVEILSRDDPSERCQVSANANANANASTFTGTGIPSNPSAGRVASGANPNRRIPLGAKPRHTGLGNSGLARQRVGLGHRPTSTGLRRGTKRPLSDTTRSLPGRSTRSFGNSKQPVLEASEDDDDDHDDHDDHDDDDNEDPNRSGLLVRGAGNPLSNIRKSGLGLGSRSTLATKRIVRKGLGNLRGGAKPKVSSYEVATTTTTTTMTTTTTATGTIKPNITPSLPNYFPGAIGNLDVPHSIRTKLRPHQIKGVEFLWNCLTGNGRVAKVSPHIHEEDDSSSPCIPRGCILGDEMGLGKTMMTIAAIAALHRQKRTNRFVVVCPSSLVNNWAREFDKWLGKVGLPKRVVVRKGGEDGLSQLRAFNAVKPTNTSEVLIVSYDLFRTNANVLEHVQNVALLVVDEGHRLKNTAGSQTMTALMSLPCDARLCITATPIQNHLGDMHTIVDFVCPGVLGDLHTFRREYERPIAKAAHKRATPEETRRGGEQSRLLDRILRSLMLRRLQKDVLKQSLPPRHVCLLFCRPTVEQREVYREVASGQTFGGGGGGGGGGSSSQDHLTALTRLRKVCIHPSLIGTNPGDNGNHGTATLGSRSGNSRGLRCETSGKLWVLRQLLEELRATAPSDKLVIVSNFTSTLTVVEDCVLAPLRLPFLRLDGSLSSADRQPLVDTFNRTSADANFALTLSSKAGGVGLNITGANRLVMVDPDWNPATDIQAMARIYREGQKKPCFIYRCFTTGTIEEVILQKQIQKESIATTTMDAPRKAKDKRNGLNAEELRDCFTLKDERCKCDTRTKIGNWPDYDGAASLIARNCADPALLALAARGDCSDSLLSFVHMVPDDEETSCNEPVSDEEATCTVGKENFFPDSDAEFEMSDGDDGNEDGDDKDTSGSQKSESWIESSDEEFEFE